MTFEADKTLQHFRDLKKGSERNEWSTISHRSLQWTESWAESLFGEQTVVKD
jgi:hypothetical protein